MMEKLKPYPAYKDSGVEWLGKVPEHWETCRLKSRLVKNDSGIWRDHHDPDGTIILRSTEQTVSGGWKIENPARLHLSDMEREAYLLQVGDLVVTKSSGSPDHIGKTSLVTEDVAALGCAFSNFMQRLRLGENTDPKLVWYYLNSPIGREQLVFQSTTTTGLGNLNGKILGNCVIALPPLSEQTAIVRFLDYMDRRIRRVMRARQRRIKLLEEYRQAVIHQAVTGQIDVRTGEPYPAYKESGVEWLGEMPAHWEISKLRNILTEVVKRNRPDLPLLSVVREKGVILRDITNRNENHNYIPDDLTNYKVVLKGQFVINKMKAWQGSFGVSPHDGIVSPAYFIFDIDGVEGTFFHKAIRSKAYIPFFTQASDGVRIGQWDLSQTRMREIPFFIPPLPEQTAIVEYLDAQTAKIDAAMAAARREIELLREYRTRLIADVVTGKVDVREVAAQLPEEPPEEGEWMDTEEATEGEAADDEAVAETFSEEEVAR